MTERGFSPPFLDEKRGREGSGRVVGSKDEGPYARDVFNCALSTPLTAARLSRSGCPFISRRVARPSSMPATFYDHHRGVSDTANVLDDRERDKGFRNDFVINRNFFRPSARRCCVFLVDLSLIFFRYFISPRFELQNIEYSEKSLFKEDKSTNECKN